MSGDVQPRKRKDKRRKKGQLEARRSEEYAEESSVFQNLDPAEAQDELLNEDLLPPGRNPSDEVIHVHKEAGLGGNICTKLIFFCLLGALGVMVGLTFFEYRGSSDADTQSAVDSPWSVMLEGWVDEASDHAHGDIAEKLSNKFDHSEEELEHEEEPPEASHEEEDREASHEDNAASEENDLEEKQTSWFSFGSLNLFGGGESEIEEKEAQSGEDDQEGGEENAEPSEEELEQSEEEEVNENDDEEEDENLSEEEQGNEEEEEEEEVDEKELSEELQELSEELPEEEGDEASEEATSQEQPLSEEQDQEEKEDNQKEPNESEELEQSAEEQNENEDEEENEIKILKSENKKVLQKVETEESDEEMFPEAIAALKEEQKQLQKEGKRIDIIEEIVPPEMEELETKEGVEEEEETSGMALKFGVGVALVVVAHVVLVKKWNSRGPVEQAASEKKFEEEKAPVPSSYEPSSPPPPPPAPSKEEVKPVEVVPDRRQTLIPEDVLIDTKGANEEEEYEEEEEEEEEADEEADREVEVTTKNYDKLLAQYGRATPDSSEPEASDDEVVEREYSDGAEESVGEEESGGEVEASEPEEEEENQKWTTIQKNEVATESEEEEEEEEEESEDEALPPPPPVASRRPAGGPKSENMDYMYGEVTNEDDWVIREELDQAEEELNNNRTHIALSKFTAILKKSPLSARGRYGKARALDVEAEIKRSNTLLTQAIEAYVHTLSAPKIPDKLYLIVATRAINRMRFKGLHIKAIPIYNQLIERFNDTPTYYNDFAINFLMMNRLTEAGHVLQKVLTHWPEDAMAQAHYGLVLKLQGNIKDSISHLEKGLASDIPETSDARLYFHLGDALSREGRSPDALKVYERGVEKGLFLSKYQRSLYNVDRLIGRPWWTLEQTTYDNFFRMLEENWVKIKQEGLAALKTRGTFLDEAENLRDVGDWKQFELFARGRRNEGNCQKAPLTCGLISGFEAARSCRRGQSKFSVMEPGTHVWPHCGPTNCRLRAHLGLVVPPGASIRVAQETRKWKEGKIIVFDDSFEHEVWHNGTSRRLVLIVDVWHPELTKQERSTLSAI